MGALRGGRQPVSSLRNSPKNLLYPSKAPACWADSLALLKALTPAVSRSCAATSFAALESSGVFVTSCAADCVTEGGADEDWSVVLTRPPVLCSGMRGGSAPLTAGLATPEPPVAEACATGGGGDVDWFAPGSLSWGVVVGIWEISIDMTASFSPCGPVIHERTNGLPTVRSDTFRRTFSTKYFQVTGILVGSAW